MEASGKRAMPFPFGFTISLFFPSVFSVSNLYFTVHTPGFIVVKKKKVNYEKGSLYFASYISET